MSDAEIRTTAHRLYHRNPQGLRQSQSLNLLSEDFISGFMEDGRMSVIRRFFCLFVTFDLVFISLLWIICVMITGDNIIHALKTQVLHYTIASSLFDIVMNAICRFIFLIVFYGCCYINHWIIIALSTSGSCAFLIAKVFYYDFNHTQQPVFEVLLILVSFVLVWIEAWFLDCRVIPQERYARNYYFALTSENFSYVEDRAPLMGAFLSSAVSGRTESIANFYSPYESVHNSDDEEEAQDDEYKRMGIECVDRAYKLLECGGWKIEKVTSYGDTISSRHQDKLGKVYKLTGKVHFPAKKLLQELYYKVEDVPKWNPTLLESKIIRKIDSHTDISYQASVGGGGGMVKSRDFVSLRCWQLCRDGKIIAGVDLNNSFNLNLSVVEEEKDIDDDDDDDTDDECILATSTKKITKCKSEQKLLDSSVDERIPSAFNTLSKSLNAKAFVPNEADDELIFSDALSEHQKELDPVDSKKSNVYVSAAISVDYSSIPATTKYIRGENKISCCAMREIPDQKDYCIFEWLLCLDLKGYIPKYVLDTAYTTLMQEYMTYLRKYTAELRKKDKVPQATS